MISVVERLARLDAGMAFLEAVNATQARAVKNPIAATILDVPVDVGAEISQLPITTGTANGNSR